MAHFTGRIEKSVAIMYGAEDLSAFPVFQGGFINFGYWEKVPEHPTKEDRICSSRRLYEEVFKHLNISKDDKVLEIGCGRGLGCVMALDQYHAGAVWGLDATPEQIKRCQEMHGPRLKRGDLNFVEGFASKVPFEKEFFHKIFSIEAAQHFPSLSPFFNEVFRTLKMGGKFAFTTFFRQPNASLEAIGKWLQTAGVQVDFFHPIDIVLEDLKKTGFTNVRCHNIGKYVWEGFHKWHFLTEPNDWGVHWIKVYRAGLVDYYIVEGVKP